MTATQAPPASTATASAPRVADPARRRRVIGLVAGFGAAALMLASVGTTWLRASTFSGDGYTLSRLPSYDASGVSTRYLLDRGHLLGGGPSIATVLILLAAMTVLAMLVRRVRVLAVVSAVGCAFLAGAFVLQVSRDVDALRTKGSHTTLVGFIGPGVYLAGVAAVLACVAFALLRGGPATTAPVVEANATG